MPGSSTLSLLFPQWQGGNRPEYEVGSRLLQWLSSITKVVEVPVKSVSESKRVIENGIVERGALLNQLKAAEDLIESKQPRRLIVFGGDCLVSQAPFAYLSSKYGDKSFGILWIDAHPDIMTPDHYPHAHAMVLGHLMGEGDPDFTARMRGRTVDPKNVIYAGLQETLPHETATIERLGLTKVGPSELIDNSDAIVEWIRERNITHLAIHLDLDVLDCHQFRSLLFCDPDAKMDALEGISRGAMTFKQILRLITDVGSHTDVVGLSLAEHFPWDAVQLEKFFNEIQPVLAPSPSGLELVYLNEPSNMLPTLGTRMLAWLANNSAFSSFSQIELPGDHDEISLEQETEDVLKSRRPDRLLILGSDSSRTEKVLMKQIGFLNSHHRQMGVIVFDSKDSVFNSIEITHYMITHESTENSNSIIQWIESNGIKSLSIFINLSILNPSKFISLLSTPPTTHIHTPNNGFTLSQLSHLLLTLGRKTSIVALSISGHIPWDSLALQQFMAALPMH
eukprot:Protomagalhaensia_wolfi_Nauph_80__2241@NODE_245_length_3065_cov_244_892597_g183_i0_p1_GENE_NODE_245_length_3065_cov_244_892597_g183_i0NODE_245_length_3065_cov_244_892597_g183_i0_p1_ORF_typecomplete_len508_score107_80Arginase/PF00491_21/2_1e36Arginase/PF00491_21/31Arginase/PF00491_21/18GvpD/PF07088_11/0_039_NODE_245_length_3065_cov_244_892597_g183_i013942917